MIRPFVPISILFSAGIVLGWAAEPNPESLYLFSILWLLATILLIPTSKPSFLFDIFALAFFLLMGAFMASIHMRVKGDDVSSIRDERPLVFHGRAISDPIRRGRSISFVMEVDGISLGRYRKPASGKALVSLWLDKGTRPPSLGFGDRAVVLGKKRGFVLKHNPGEPRWDQIFALKGIRARISAKRMVVQGHGDRINPLSRLALLFRNTAIRSIELAMPDPLSASIMEGLLLGRQEGIPTDLTEAFRRTNTIHVLVVSGGNVAVLTGFVYFLLRLLGSPWLVRYVFALASIIVFSLATGMEPSVTRASAMAAIWIAGVMVGRRPDPLGIMSLAVFLILLFKPLSLLELGFILSVAAVLSIILFMPIIYHKLSIFGRWAAGIIGTSLAAQAGVAPILAFHFSTLSLISPISNIMIVPLAGILTPIGLGIAIVTPIFPAIGEILGILAWALIQLLVFLVKALSSIPGSVLYLGSPPLWAVIAFYILLGSWLLIGTRRWLLLAGSALALLISFSAIPHGHEPYILYLNVGQGSSTSILTPCGKRILIDGGPPGSGKWAIMPYIRGRGANRLDLILITHPHEDHTAGILELIEGGMEVGMMVGSGVRIGTKTLDMLLAQAKKKGIRTVAVSEGAVIDVDKRTRIRILGPEFGALRRPSPYLGSRGIDDLSLVLMVEMDGKRFLFPGDIRAQGQEMAMRRAGRLLRCDILLLPHHGDYEPTTRSFLEMCRPRAAIAQAGIDNPYGLPDPRTAKLCKTMGIRFYSSDVNGPIKVTWKGDQVMVTSLSPALISPIGYAFSPKSQRRRTMASASSE
jgi:competence protein ComEC